MSGHHFNPADQYYNYPTTQATEVMPEVSTLYQMVMDLGIPQSELAKAEREEFWKKDEEHDARLLDMIEKSSDAILQIKLALDANTNAIKELMNKK
jgi:hypothetical protein